jgi:uncharacterized membrane protein YdjX (TVP38/TMEM64 family)/pimeloyl-ACP methyl ester carboxylesterase
MKIKGRSTVKAPFIADTIATRRAGPVMMPPDDPSGPQSRPATDASSKPSADENHPSYRPLTNNHDEFSHAPRSVFKFNYLRAALLMEGALLVTAAIIAWSFWHVWCPNGVEQCIGDTRLGPAHYLLLSLVRPFVLTPHVFGTYLAARTFSEGQAIMLAALASMLSTIPLYGLTYILGRSMVIPWMSRNLPSTLRLIQTQDYKIIFAARLIPIFPFDVVSFLAGAFNLRPRRVLLCTFLGTLPECVFLVYMSSPKVTLLGWTVNAIGLTAGLIIAPLLVFEWISRKQGRGMYATLLAAYREILAEASLNNQIVRRNRTIAPGKVPVLLIYGFFSSQRSLNVIERQLVAAGFDVMSFNLGGLFGTFFTQGVMETASFIDYKLKRQMDRHGFNKVHIVAHSKGSLVALWWLLKLGGSKYCDRLVTMAAPCNGSYFTYLALVTPLGFFWRDVWQMRPGSSFLKYLKDSDVPDSLKIFCLYSEKDTIARGKLGTFSPRSGIANITNIAMNDMSHFDFIVRREPIKEVIKILKDDPETARLLDAEDVTPLSLIGDDVDSVS